MLSAGVDRETLVELSIGENNCTSQLADMDEVEIPVTSTCSELREERQEMYNDPGSILPTLKRYPIDQPTHEFGGPP